MYQQSYNDVAQDSASNARDTECLAFEKANRLLAGALNTVQDSKEFNEALRYLEDLWSILLEDLILPENALPKELRAKLVSIGIWVLKRCATIRDGAGHDFQAFIEVNNSMLKGLKGRA